MRNSEQMTTFSLFNLILTRSEDEIIAELNESREQCHEDPKQLAKFRKLLLSPTNNGEATALAAHGATKGWFPLMYLAKRGMVRAMIELLNFGADDRIGPRGLNAVIVAIQHGRLNILESQRILQICLGLSSVKLLSYAVMPQCLEGDWWKSADGQLRLAAILRQLLTTSILLPDTIHELLAKAEEELTRLDDTSIEAQVLRKQIDVIKEVQATRATSSPAQPSLSRFMSQERSSPRAAEDGGTTRFASMPEMRRTHGGGWHVASPLRGPALFGAGAGAGAGSTDEDDVAVTKRKSSRKKGEAKVRTAATTFKNIAAQALLRRTRQALARSEEEVELLESKNARLHIELTEARRKLEEAHEARRRLMSSDLIGEDLLAGLPFSEKITTIRNNRHHPAHAFVNAMWAYIENELREALSACNIQNLTTPVASLITSLGSVLEKSGVVGAGAVGGMLQKGSKTVAEAQTYNRAKTAFKMLILALPSKKPNPEIDIRDLFNRLGTIVQGYAWMLVELHGCFEGWPLETITLRGITLAKQLIAIIMSDCFPGYQPDIEEAISQLLLWYTTGLHHRSIFAGLKDKRAAEEDAHLKVFIVDGRFYWPKDVKEEHLAKLVICHLNGVAPTTTHDVINEEKVQQIMTCKLTAMFVDQLRTRTEFENAAIPTVTRTSFQTYLSAVLQRINLVEFAQPHYVSLYQVLIDELKTVALPTIELKPEQIRAKCCGCFGGRVIPAELLIPEPASRDGQLLMRGISRVLSEFLERHTSLRAGGEAAATDADAHQPLMAAHI